MCILEIKDLVLIYKGKKSFFNNYNHKALNGISFSIKRGEIIGVLGGNGSGKSSLLKIIAGIISPTSGTVYTKSDTRCALLALGLGFNNELTGRDNALLSMMFQGTTKYTALNILESIKEFSELGDFFERPVKTYSSGMRARLGFTIALKNEVDILLIDEILSVGDTHFRSKAEQAMIDKLGAKQTAILVSHNKDQITRLCKRSLWLEDGKLKIIGDTKRVVNAYEHWALGS